jgi:hypothetical protein
MGYVQLSVVLELLPQQICCSLMVSQSSAIAESIVNNTEINTAKKKNIGLMFLLVLAI